MSSPWLDDNDPAVKAARAANRAAENQSGSDPDPRYVPPTTGRDFVLEKIEWLWPGWLARGKFHLLAGQKGAGKSTLIFDLMARVSVGELWPDGSQAPLGDVLIWSGEDCIEDTILPRFVAAGGDLNRIPAYHQASANLRR